MLEKGARVELKEGLTFYEQDIQFSKYLFTGDIEVEAEIDYLRPGFGFVLLEQERGREASGDICIVRVGDRDFGITLKERGVQRTPVYASSPVKVGIKKMPITFRKKGRRVEIESAGLLLGYYMLEKDIDRFKIGFYSSAGNTIQKVSLISGAPGRWNINIGSSGGGRIQFARDGFSIEDCKYNAEIEDDDIRIPAGKYSLSFISSEVNGKYNIEPYIYEAKDKRFDALEKNILKNGVFEVKEDTTIVLHFKGTNGSVEKISIKENPEEGYVPTESGARKTEGSNIIVKLLNLSKIMWTGTVDKVPTYSDNTSEKEYDVFSIGEVKLTEKDLNLALGAEYGYTFDVDTASLEVVDEDGKAVYSKSHIAEPGFEKAYLFQNVRGVIRELIVKKKDNEEINVLIQRTTKVFVPASVKGPIIATGEERIPFDLSSSYRITRTGEDMFYEFTNWEREVFDPMQTLILEKSIIDLPGNISVYGIPKGVKTQESKIFDLKAANDPLGAYAERYNLIEESEYDVNLYRNSITFVDNPANAYEKVVIDYLKNKSYSINYREDLKSYEVDVATTEKGIYMMYDYREDKSGMGVVEGYTITNIKPDEGGNRFVVLRKE